MNSIGDLALPARATPTRPRLTSALPLASVLFVSAVVWCLLFILIPPARQDFPLADDWAFAQGAFCLAGGQGIRYFQWAAMPQLGQWLWAWPFIQMFGATHAVLRLSTIVLSWLGLAAFYELLRQEGTRPWPAAFLTAVLAFDPIFFLLQGTFMTDIPTLALALVALALYGRAARSGRNIVLLGAVIFAVLAIITRQTAIMVPVAAAVLLLRDPQLRGRTRWLVALALPLFVGLITYQWFQAKPDIKPTPAVIPRPEAVFIAPFLVFHLCGLAILPVLFLDPRPALRMGFGIASVLMLGLAYYWDKFGNILTYQGLFPYVDGMVTPTGAYSPFLFPGTRPIVLTDSIRLALTVLGCLGAGYLLVRLAMQFPADLVVKPALPLTLLNPLLAFTVLQFPLILLAPYVFDRYLLLFVPGALMIARPKEPLWKGAWLPGVAALAVMAAASVGLMHDWLAWNVPRWDLGREAVQKGVPPQNIEGGFEWNGWWEIRQTLAKQPAAESRDRFVLSFSPLPDKGSVTEERPYTQWFAPGPRSFYLVKLFETATPVGE